MLGARIWQVSLIFYSRLSFDPSLFIFPGCCVELSPGPPALFSEAAAHLKKLELETVKAAGPWPALHININKVPVPGALHEHGLGPLNAACLLNHAPVPAGTSTPSFSTFLLGLSFRSKTSLTFLVGELQS